MRINRDQKGFPHIIWFLIVCLFAIPLHALPESPFDTPINHYNEGMKYLKVDELEKGRAEFEKALQLNKKFAPAYEGMGNYYLAKKSLQEALANFNQAKKGDKNYAPGYTGMGKAYYLQGNYKKAQSLFKDAIKKPAGYNTTEAYYYLGFCYIKEEKLDKASEIFSQGLAFKPDNPALIEAMENLSRIKTALFGLGKEVHSLALAESITRADAAALVVTQLGLERVFGKDTLLRQTTFVPPKPLMGKQKSPNTEYQMGKDIKDDFWARSYIEKMLELGLMENFPDEEFKPEEKLSRASFAVLIQNILVKAYEDPSLATKYLDRESEFADLPSTHFAYNAAVLVVSRGILKPKSDSRFGVLDNVSGAEAILAIRKLREQFTK